MHCCLISWQHIDALIAAFGGGGVDGEDFMY
jgi:hypothetical protein